MAKSHAMARCQGYIASVRKAKKKKTTKKNYQKEKINCEKRSFKVI